MLRACKDGYVVPGPAAARREAVHGLLATRAGPAAAALHGRREGESSSLVLVN